MHAIKTPIDQSTAAGLKHWHELRRKHIGGSEVAALMQCHPRLTAFELYHQKKGNLMDDIGDAFWLAEHGKYMEAFIARVITAENNWSLERCNNYLSHPTIPGLGCTLDYEVVQSEYGPGIAELKCVLPFQMDGWREEQAPPHIEYQMQLQLMVSGCKWGAIVPMFNGNPETIHPMMRFPDERAFKVIEARVRKFWSNFAADIEPDLEGSKDYEPVLELYMDAEEAEPAQVFYLHDVKGIDGKLATIETLRETQSKCARDIKALKAEVLHLAMQRADGKAPSYLLTNEFELGLKKEGRNGYTVKPSTSLKLDITRINKNAGSYGE